MCVYKILAHSKDGCIILCNECSHYQLAFGTTGVSFDADTFHNFCNYVICVNDSVNCNGFENEKRIKVDLFSKSTMMILSYKELRGLYGVVCEAKFNMETDNLFKELNLITE